MSSPAGPRLLTKVAWETRNSTMTYSEEIAMEMRPSSQRRPYAFSMQQQQQYSPTSLPYLVQSSKTTQQRTNGHGSLRVSSASAPSSAPSSASSTTRSRTLGERALAWGSTSTPSSTATTLRHSASRQQERVELSSSSEDEEETEEELGSSAHRRANTTRDDASVIEYRALCKHFHSVPVTSFERIMQEREVAINSHGLGPHGARALAAALVNNATVERIELRDNDIKGAGAQAFVDTLCENAYIMHLDLSSNNLQSEGIHAFAKAMAKGDIPRLQSLSLNRNGFLDMDSTSICSALKERNELALLHLSGNRFSDVAACRFADMLKFNEGLRSLDLSWNCIRARGGSAIGDALAVNRGLEHLNLSHNGIGDAAVIAISAALQGQSHLQTLNVAKCDIHDKGAAVLAAMLRSNSSLTSLDISHNPISASGMKLIIEAIGANTHIKDFHFEGIPLPEELQALLRSILQKRPDLKVKTDSTRSSGSEHDRLKKKLKDLSLKYSSSRRSSVSSKPRRGSSFAIELDAGGVPIRRWPSDAYNPSWSKEEKWIRGYNPDGTIRADLAWLTNEMTPFDPSWTKQLAWEAGYNPDGSVRTDPEYKQKRDGHRVSYKPSTKSFDDALMEEEEEEEEEDDQLGELTPHRRMDRLSSRRFSELYPTLMDPMQVLENFVQSNNLRLVDLFFEIDKDRSGFVTMEETKTAIGTLNLNLNEIQLNELMFRLDLDGDGQLNYHEFAEGRRVLQERTRSRDPHWKTRFNKTAQSGPATIPEGSSRSGSRNSSSKSILASRPTSTEP